MEAVDILDLLLGLGLLLSGLLLCLGLMIGSF